MSMNSKSNVLLPASLTADASDLRQKTLKIGRFGRALSIFRVNQVFIYDDEDPRVEDQEKEASLITTLLRYQETPQYLRKALFPYMEELRFAGLLSPLRTPHHPLQDERNEEGDCREAVVLKSGENESRLNLGLSEEGVFEGELEEGSRVTVKLGEKLDEDRRLVHPAEKGDIDEYWGFEVSRADSLAQSLSKAKADYSIGTSRRGQNLYEAVGGIKTNSVDSVAVAFGGPYWGLFEICEGQGVDPDDLFDVMVNAIPQQGTATVRSEEALVATFAIMNVMFGRK